MEKDQQPFSNPWGCLLLLLLLLLLLMLLLLLLLLSPSPPTENFFLHQSPSTLFSTGETLPLPPVLFFFLDPKEAGKNILRRKPPSMLPLLKSCLLLPNHSLVQFSCALIFSSPSFHDRSMVPDRSPIHYACVSRGTTILADVITTTTSTCGDFDLETLALKYLEKTPLLHLRYSHTSRRLTYSFLMEDPFVFFAILDEDLGRPQGFQFLNRTRDSFMRFLKDKKHIELTRHCFHEEFSPVLRGLMRFSPPSERVDVSECRRKCGSVGKVSKKKKTDEMVVAENHRVVDKENKLGLTVVDGNQNGLPLQKMSHGGIRGIGPQQAKRVWKRHLQMVLFIDLVICAVLFGIWLSICKGFQCIDR